MELITPAQCRAARALLNWSQPELAELCNMHVQTISAFESESSTPSKRTLEKIVEVFLNVGIEFLSTDGVRRTGQGVRTYKGRQGFVEFMRDVYETIRTSREIICVSNIDEGLFTRYLGKEHDDAYMDKVAKLYKSKKFDFRIMIKSGDTNFIASEYAEYRWIKEEFFYTAPVYIYGSKTAFIIFDDDVTIHVINNRDIAETQRLQFNAIWEIAERPPMSEARPGGK
jgi:transcriptional regulator with XRE-family HTH domain